MKKQYESVIPSKLPADLKEAYDLIKFISDDFTDFSDKELAENAKTVFEKIKKNFPSAIKGEKATKPTAPKPSKPTMPSTPKPSKPSKPSTPKPAKPTITKPKNDKVKEKIAEINKEVEQIIAKLKDQDKIKMRVAKELDDYMKKNGLGRTEQDSELMKAKQRLKLYKSFQNNDVAKLKRLRKSASGGALGMKVEPNKTKAKKSSKPKKMSVIDRLEKALFPNKPKFK